MRALVMREPAADATATAVEERPEPTPGPGELAVEVAHAGVNVLDVMARRGDPGYADAWPYRPGLEVAGRVRALGPGTDGFAIGDRVAAFTRGGGFADVVVAPGGRTALFGNPSGGVPAPLPPLGRLIGGNVALAGFSVSRLVASAPHRVARALRDVLDLVADGRVVPTVPVVEGLAEVAGVHDLLAAGRGGGKYVVAVS